MQIIVNCARYARSSDTRKLHRQNNKSAVHPVQAIDWQCIESSRGMNE